MGELLLNIAATCVGTTTLGPGFRSVVWVQGCNLSCPGCISPEWIPHTTNQLITPHELADSLLSNPAVTGITISGGEPMLQAPALIELLEGIKKKRAVNTICFTGYKYEFLINNPPNDFVEGLLEHLDVLIDGPYIHTLNDNLGLRGSSNQRFIHLTDQLAHVNFTSGSRSIEYHVQDGQLFMVGVPPLGIPQRIDSTIPMQVKAGYDVRP